MSIFYVRAYKVVPTKTDFYMIYAKMTKFSTKIGLFAMHVFVFFT
jgi:hypothetical protein